MTPNQQDTIPPHVRNFLGKVQGVCVGVAMSGEDHPNPDEVLMELFNEAQAILFPSDPPFEDIDRNTMIEDGQAAGDWYRDNYGLEPHKDTRHGGDQIVQAFSLGMRHEREKHVEPDTRAGRRIAPVEVYTILNKALKEDRLIDRLSPLSREIAELSRITPVPEHIQEVLDYQANYYSALSPDRK